MNTPINQLNLKTMNMAHTNKIDNSLLLKNDRDRMLLWWYFLIVQEFESKGQKRLKPYLYAQAGQKVFLSSSTAGKIINRRLKDKDFVRDVQQML